MPVISLFTDVFENSGRLGTPQKHVLSQQFPHSHLTLESIGIMEVGLHQRSSRPPPLFTFQASFIKPTAAVTYVHRSTSPDIHLPGHVVIPSFAIRSHTASQVGSKHVNLGAVLDTSASLDDTVTVQVNAVIDGNDTAHFLETLHLVFTAS